MSAPASCQQSPERHPTRRSRFSRQTRVPGARRDLAARGFFVYSLLAYDPSSHSGVMYNPFPVRCPRSGGTLQAPLCLPPRPFPGRCDGNQGNYNSERGRQKQYSKEKSAAQSAPYAVPADAVKSGMGRKSRGGSPPASGSSARATCSSIHSRSFASDTSLTASSSSAGIAARGTVRSALASRYLADCSTRAGPRVNGGAAERKCPV